MKKTTVIVILLLLTSFACHTQSDSLPRLNAKGKKEGYWKVYYSDSLRETDSVKAKYYGYCFYDYGKRITEAFRSSPKFKNIKVSKNEVMHPFGIQILNGEYEYKYRIHILKKTYRVVEEYKNGFLIHIKEYLISDKHKTYKENECLYEYIDNTKTYNNQTGSYYYEIKYYDDGTIRRFWYRKNKKKWSMCEIKG